MNNTIKTTFAMTLIFISLLLWHASANAEVMAHWANVRYSNGDLIGTVSAGEWVDVLGTAEDVYRSYVYVPSLGCYGYICSVYIYGGSDYDYDHPFEYGSYSGTYYNQDNWGYAYEEPTFTYAEEDYVYHYNDTYTVYDSYYDTYGGYSDTWVEVDISDQTARLWDGRDVVAEDYCVTGMADKSPTPEGSYYIYEKTRNEVLRGYNYDGSTYAAEVNFWMPFYGGIGLHDATWRGSFGGTIYQYNGSHGCVNLPYSLASAIWQETEIGSPVVVHK